ncbi:MAG: hypothetical protein ACXWNC_05090, partial [Anaerolineales bacterium]
VRCNAQLTIEDNQLKHFELSREWVYKVQRNESLDQDIYTKEKYSRFREKRKNATIEMRDW